MRRILDRAFLEARMADKPVLVNFTADWCITCKVNEKVAMSSGAFHQQVKNTGTVLLKGDWTRYNEEITKILNHFNRKGVT